MLAVSSCWIFWNIRCERASSQWTARSEIGTPQVRPLSPSTWVIAAANLAAVDRTGVLVDVHEVGARPC